MAAQQEKHPVDDLFRQTFNDLPASGASSGWDTPSDRVWEQVQVGLKTTPRSGWSAGASWLAALGLVVVAATAWWLTSRPAATPAASPSTEETPVVTPPSATPATTPNKVAPAPTDNEPQTTNTVTAKPHPAVNSTGTTAKTPETPAANTGRQAPPNSTERAKQQTDAPKDH